MSELVIYTHYVRPPAKSRVEKQGGKSLTDRSQAMTTAEMLTKVLQGQTGLAKQNVSYLPEGINMDDALKTLSVTRTPGCDISDAFREANEAKRRIDERRAELIEAQEKAKKLADDKQKQDTGK